MAYLVPRDPCLSLKMTSREGQKDSLMDIVSSLYLCGASSVCLLLYKTLHGSKDIKEGKSCPYSLFIKRSTQVILLIIMLVT